MPPPLYDPAEEEENKHTDALAPGTVLNDCYRVQDVLGKGGFGITYLAEKLSQGADAEPGAGQGYYVIKENLCSLTARRDVNGLDVICYKNNALFDWSLSNFIKEAQILAQLQHQNIVPVLEAFEQNGTAYIVMPFIQGDDLTRHAPQRDKEGAAWLESLLPPLLSALEYMHGEGIIHRDIKPDNILLTGDGGPMLIDFGAARMMDLDSTQAVLGTPGFAPPEQLRHDEPPQPSFDVYALGATFYYMVTGQLPADSQVRQERAFNNQSDPLPPLARQKRYQYFYSHSFLAGIDRALSLRSTDRWQSAAEWLEDLTFRPAPSRLPRVALYVALAGVPLVAGGIFLSDVLTDSPATRPVQMQTEAQSAQDAEAKAAAEKAAARRATAEQINRVAAEQAAEREAEKAAREAAIEQAAREAEEKAAAERAAREAAEQAVRESAIELLREHGVKDGTYAAALLEKAGKGDKNLVEQLLLLGADVNHMTKRGETPLYMAARNGHTELVRQLLAVPGIDVETACRKEKWTRLHLAASAGLADLFAEQLRQGADINQKDQKGNTAFSLAARNGHTHIVRQLLDEPENAFNATDALIYAATGGMADVVQVLIDSGQANVNHAEDGSTALYRAAEGGHLEVVRLLLKAPGIRMHLAKENLELKDPEKNRTFCTVLPQGDVTPLEIALFNKHPEVALQLLNAPKVCSGLTKQIFYDSFWLAVHRGYPDVVRRLGEIFGDYNLHRFTDYKFASELLRKTVRQGNVDILRELLDIDFLFSQGLAGSFLHLAASEGHTDMVRMLLDLNQLSLDMERACKLKGWTELHFAAAAGLTESVEFLTACGGDVNEVDKDENTPLCLAAASGHVDVMQVLLTAPDIRPHKSNPLFVAVEKGRVDAVRLLLDVRGLKINKLNRSGDAVIHVSLKSGNTEVTEVLLQARGIDINKPDKRGLSPLHLAVYYRYEDVVELLLDSRRIRLNQPDKRGLTPLHLAAHYGYADIVRLLLDSRGIRLNQPDKRGFTPLHLAAYSGHADVVRLLLGSDGIQLNQPDRKGRTPLMIAQQRGKEECAELIQQALNR